MRVVTFSGGCVSGKTTMMNAVRENLASKGIKCVFMDEIMREKKINSIDDIRSAPGKYLSLQEDIIMEKVNLERMIKFSTKSIDADVVLIDRALSDSLFYLLFYTDKSKLTTAELQRFEALYAYVNDHAKYMFERIYDLVIFFKPLSNVKVDDKFRPKNIDILKYTESRMIEMLNTYFCMGGCRMMSTDLNNDHDDKALSHITRAIWDLL